MRRWDTDQRGSGVADARGLLPEAQRLLEAMEAGDWVAEEPEAHLLPQLRRACSDERLGLRLDSAHSPGDGSFVVELGWIGESTNLRGRRMAVYALLGTIIEPASFIREAHEDGCEVWTVVTGVLDGDSAFAPHGHVVVLRIADATRDAARA